MAYHPQLPNENEISTLSKQAQVIYAARCAFRVYPLIGADGSFDFWGTDAKQHLEAVFAAIISALCNDRVANNATVAAEYAVEEANAIPATKAAALAAKAAQTDSEDAFSDAYDSSTYAAEAAGVFFGKASIVTQAARLDYENLKKYREGQKIPWSFFKNPLFDERKELYTEDPQNKINKAFASVGCEPLLKTWFQFRNGRIPTHKAIRKWLSDWDRAYRSQNSEQSGVNKTKPKNTQETGKTNDTKAFPTVPSSDPDNPARIDRLGRKVLIESLADMLSMSQQKTPLTIGLFGHWGSGKSSVMRLLQRRLSDNEKHNKEVARRKKKRSPGFWSRMISCLTQPPKKQLRSEPDPADFKKREFLFSWFNCWEYEQTENIPASLAQEVVRGLLTDGRYEEEGRQYYTEEVGCFSKFWIRIQFLFEKENRSRTVWLLARVVFVLFLATAAAIPYIINQSEFATLGIVVWLKKLGDHQTLQYMKLLGGGVLAFAGLLAWHLFKQGTILWNHPLTTEMATYFKLPSYREELGQIPAIRRQLKSLCKVRLYKGNKAYRRLLVFVDDLDRCKPETIAKAFDAIRLIAAIEEVAVIVGIDERIAFKAMGEAYKNYAEPRLKRYKEDVARDYLGKIIQVPIRLSSPPSEDLVTYIEKELFIAESDDDPGNEPVKPNPKPDPKASTGGGDQRTKSDSTTAIDSAGSDDGSDLDRLEALLKLMHETVEEVDAFKRFRSIFNIGNPRQLLRLRNSYRFLKRLSSLELQKRVLSVKDVASYEYTLMLMLFWLEFRTESTTRDIETWFERYEQGSIKKINEETSKNQRWMKFFFDAIDRGEEGFHFKKEHEVFLELEEFTNNCVLPYPKKEILINLEKSSS